MDSEWAPVALRAPGFEVHDWKLALDPHKLFRLLTILYFLGFLQEAYDNVDVDGTINKIANHKLLVQV